MDRLYKKLQLNSLDEWIFLPVKKFGVINGGENLLKLYNHNLYSLLTSIYPNYPWKKRESEKITLKSLPNSMIALHRNKIEQLYDKLQLQSLSEWVSVPQNVLVRNVSGKLFSNYQSLFKVLTLLYPNYPWSELKSHYVLDITEHKSSYLTHSEYIDKLYTQFNLHFLDGWLNVSHERLMRRGKRLMEHYGYNRFNLLKYIYPNYPWDFTSKLLNFNARKVNSKTLYAQHQIYMDQLFDHLKLKNLDDWILLYFSKMNNCNVERKIICKSFAKLYPNFPWDSTIALPKSLFKNKIKEHMNEYHITQKKDWYRISTDSNRNSQMIEILKLFFPSEKWNKAHFTLRSKKSTQRLLFSCTQKIYPTLLIFENYFHPKLIIHAMNNYELDLFIPALQLALEYQGEHHYDDIPSGFAGVEVFQNRDYVKEKLTSELAINIVKIPYWWDRSLHSLYSYLQCFNFL